MVFVLDNYDSFTYNLVQYLGELGAAIHVRRNDRVTVEEIAALQPTHIVISPGPGRPEDAGITEDVIRRFSQSVPLLSHVAQTLFIVRAEATRQQVLKEALQVVGGAPNLALVLNQCQQTFGANYYYEYGGGYHADPKRLTQQ